MADNGPALPHGDIWVRLADRRDGRLAFKLSFSPDIGKYFNTDTFFIEYDEDIRNVDESILYIPVIANVAPVSWATGARIHVKELDETFIGSLRIIRNNIKSLFPGFSCAGDVDVEYAVSNRFCHKGAAQLFTGGVDSLATYARHRDEKPALIALEIFKPYNRPLQGIINRELYAFAGKEGVNFHRVRSNLNYAFFNQKRLLADYGQCLFEASWWASIQHGLGLLGMCAPLTTVLDIQKIYIASSATKSVPQGVGRPWGSHPYIDGNVAWADVKAVHDGLEWSRQEKIRHAIKPYIDGTGEYPKIIVCDETLRGDVLNCGRCEKCCRTIVGLALEGIDPNRCGFDVNAGTFDRIRQKLLWDRLMFAYNKSGMWKDIQSAIPDTIKGDLYGSKAFFEWLRTQEFPGKWDKYKPLSQRLLQKCLKLGIIQ